jgi:hypothetical protein
VGKPPFNIYYNDGQNAGMVENFNQTSGTFPLDLIADDSTQFMIVLDSLVDDNGCWSYHPDSLPGIARALLFKYPVPVLQDDTVTVCADNILLSVQADVGEGSWGPPGAFYDFTPADQAISTFSATFTNDTLFYTVVWSEQNGICPLNDTSAVLVIELYEPPDPPDAGQDSIIYFASNINLWAEPASAGLATWSVEGTALIDPAGIHANNAAVDLGDSDLDETVENTFTWTIRNGTCPVQEASVQVARQDIRQYSGFSPDNGDDINQYFELPGLEYADEFIMQIITRRGVVIRTIDKSQGEEFMDPDMWWDGLLDDGQKAPDGTYFYILVVKHAGQAYEYKGFVELVRTASMN